jgi:hypothetical protein
MEAAAKEDKHPEAARRSSTYDASSTLARGHSVRLRSGSGSTGIDREQDPYSGVMTLLQQLGCPQALQEFKNKGCSDAVAANLKVDELVKFGLVPVKAQVACLSRSGCASSRIVSSLILFQEFIAQFEKMKADKESSAISREVEVEFERFRSPSPNCFSRQNPLLMPHVSTVEFLFRK